jgi:SAM-dependent methyltransferase
LDRWFWLKRKLAKTHNGENLLDLGCGSGSFTIGAAKRGYQSLGLSWDERNQKVASERAKLCKAPDASFGIQDLRHLNERKDLINKFDVVICLEVAEHILDDHKLIVDISKCLKPGGRLLITTPYFHYKAITSGDNGPFLSTETGWHVRRGYTQAMFRELCEISELRIETIDYCSGYLSQKITGILRKLSNLNFYVGWFTILPLRILPPLFDKILTKLLNWPFYSICLEAYKPRISIERRQWIEKINTLD